MTKEELSEMKILIVDDKEENLYMLESLLKGSGYEVALARNGVEALEELKNDSFDLIISDILMPKMDGFQLCRECKSNDAFKKIPFIFYTATYTGKKDEKFGLNLGAARYMVKPIEPESFIEIVRGTLTSHKNGLPTSSEIPVEVDKDDYLKEYSARLSSKLEQEVAKLEITNRTLRASEAEREKFLHEMGERMKELRCMHEIATSIRKRDTLEQLFREAVALIPPGWQYPEFTRAKIVFDGEEYYSEPFDKTKWKQVGDLIVDGDKRGVVEVYYLERFPELDEGPFLKEERKLINWIARTLSETIEHKRSSQAVRKLSLAVEQSPSSVVITDTKGNIEYVNPKFMQLTGYTAEEVIGQNPRILKSGETPQEEYKKLWETITSGHEWHGEFHNVKKNGELYWLLASISPIKDDNGVITHFLSVREDITERKRVELELAKEHKLLEEANNELKKAFEQEAALRGQLVNAERLACLGDMAAKIAHEINNPLTVIKGQAEIQLMKVEDQEYRKTLKIILDKSTEVAELTRRYMDLGKPHEVKVKPILFSNVVKKTVDSLKSLGLLKRIEMSESYLEDEPQIIGDEVSLEQVLRNLVINAIQAIPEYKKGEIAIGTKMANHGKGVEAYVSDNGMGIKEEDLEKIFNPYFTTKKEGVGTGLGLMISKEIVEVIHGGRIDVESTLEKGTTIHVTLPIGKYALKKKKILVVDDEAYITDLFSEYLSSKGFLIRKSNNGRDALKLYAEFKPDLVLSDIDMPEMNGLELHAEIEKINPKQPFIMITGAFLKPDELKTLSRKKIPQIIKPAELEKELLKVVKEQLEMSSM